MKRTTATRTQTAERDAIAAMAAAILASDGEPERDTCSRCGARGYHTHCTDGRVLCATCRPSTSRIDYESYDEDGDDEAEEME